MLGVMCTSKSMSFFALIKFDLWRFFNELGKAVREFIYKKPFRIKLPSTQKELFLRKLEIIVK